MQMTKIWLRQRFKSPLEREREYYRRYRNLSRQIDAAPSMSNHLLRGEMSLERGDFRRALADFNRVLELAESMDASKSWLLLEQALRDRALFGKRVAQTRAATSADRPGMYQEA